MSDYQSFQIQAASEQQSGPNVRVLGGVERATAGSGHQPEQPIGVHRGTAVDYSAHQSFSQGQVPANADAIQTARSPMGRALAPSEVNAQSLVTVGGIEMEARVAERLGYLTKDASGYRAGAHPTAQEAPQQAQGAASDAASTNAGPQLSEAATDLLNGYNGNVSAGDLVHAAHEFFDGGEVGLSTIGRIASQRGVEPEQVMADIENIRQGFMDQAAAAIGSPEYLEAAQSLFANDFKAAVKAQTMNGDLSHFAALTTKVTDYALSKAQSIESEDADIRVRTVHGKTMVFGPGIPYEMDVRLAAKMGLVSVRQG